MRRERRDARDRVNDFDIEKGSSPIPGSDSAARSCEKKSEEEGAIRSSDAIRIFYVNAPSALLPPLPPFTVL